MSPSTLLTLRRRSHVAAIREISRLAEQVGGKAVDLDSAVLAPDFAVALTNSGWSSEILVVHCVERPWRKIGNPTAWLHTHLTTKVNTHVTKSARMRAAEHLEAFWSVEDDIEEAGYDLGHETPGLVATSRLYYADVIDSPAAAMPKLFDVKPGHLENFCLRLGDVIAETRRRIAEIDAERAAAADARYQERTDTCYAFGEINLPADSTLTEAAAALTANHYPLPRDDLLVEAHKAYCAAHSEGGLFG